MRLSSKILAGTLAMMAWLPATANLQDVDQDAAQAAASPRQNVASTNADPAWRPPAAMRAAIEVTTRAYFRARDANRAEEAYAYLSPRQKQYVPFPVYQGHLREFNAKAGAVQGRQLRAVTWYKDTPQAGPGLYVAVDYSADFANLALQCGYVVWHEQPDGSFLQIREETNMIDKDTMSKLGAPDLERVRAQFRC